MRHVTNRWTHVTARENKMASSKSVRPRGSYGSYISQPLAKMPRTTCYRKRKQLKEPFQSAFEKTVDAREKSQIVDLDVDCSCDSTMTEFDTDGDGDIEFEHILPDQDILSGRKSEDNSPGVCVQEGLDDKKHADFAEIFSYADEHIHCTYLEEETVSECDDPALVYGNYSYLINNTDEHCLDDVDNQDFEVDGFSEDDDSVLNSEDGEFEVSSGSCANFHSKNVESVPLFEGAQINLAISMLLIITFAVRHSLTGVALADLLHLIDVHVLVPNTFASSIAIFVISSRNLRILYSITITAHIASNILALLKKLITAPTSIVFMILQKKSGCGYFIIIPLATQLQALLASK